MSFDYLYDLFGRFREKKQNSLKLKSVLRNSLYAKGDVERDSFGDQMETVRRDFNALMKDEFGNYVFDQNTPGWLNLFLGNKFSRWNRMCKIMNAARQNQEMKSSTKWAEALEIFDAEEKRLLEAISCCLEEMGN